MKIRGNTVTTTQKEKKSLLLTGGKMEGSLDMNLQELTNIRNPVNERDAVNKKFLEDTISASEEKLKEETESYADSKAESLRTNSVSVSLVASGWSESAPFIQNVTVEGLSDEYYVMAYPDIPDDAVEEESLAGETAKVTSCKRTGNQLTFRCREEKPSMDIPVIVEVYP